MSDTASSRLSAAQQFMDRVVEVGAGPVHLVEVGDAGAAPILFLHGWPQSWRAWLPVMQLAAGSAHRLLAIDLPGVGGSEAASTDGSTDALASVVDDLIRALDLSGVTLVGHDLGGMIVYAYLRSYDEAVRAVIMDTVIPGIAPWDEVLANPYLWHFAFHSIPGLPELLVAGKQRAYFDFFFDALSAEGSGVSDEARESYARAYASDEALSAGFDWYRMLRQDAASNAAASGNIATPLLYMRGDHEGGDMDAYVTGLRDAGLLDVRSSLIEGAGHFAPEDAPAAVWGCVADFIAGTSS